ncbi:MAG: 5'/3'-nucleotidase SurE [Bacteroidales bacterium]|nr:5'/3'-nucleotidase SurE [Bacteroidales bacterium]MDD3011369.1 5'/3'-nucleotidase SurE [Bacteroidales bacterium]MDD3960533.1 5'/3'-nucleotidase SurE [Bacteroidales bacterium]
MKHKPYFFITNDDGIFAPGIRTLIDIVKPLGKVIVVAPDKGHSGQSHAVTVGTPVRLNKLVSDPDYDEYSCSGTPVDCVKLGLQQLANSKPDMLLSGINHGSNAGINVLYSGTMAAAMEGTINQVPSLGFSLTNYSHQADFSGTRDSIHAIITRFLNHPLPAGVTMNVNIPDLPAHEIKGIKFCRQAQGRWYEEFDRRVDPFGKDYFWLTGEYRPSDNNPGTDQWALDNGYVAMVPLTLDLTHLEYLNQKKEYV